MNAVVFEIRRRSVMSVGPRHALVLAVNSDSDRCRMKAQVERYVGQYARHKTII